jgi:hypothetical protein
VNEEPQETKENQDPLAEMDILETEDCKVYR